jgi:hypothetical protein
MVRDWFRRRRQDEGGSTEYYDEALPGQSGTPRPYNSLDGGPSSGISSGQGGPASGHSSGHDVALTPWDNRYPAVQYSVPHQFSMQYGMSPQTPSPFARLSSTPGSLAASQSLVRASNSCFRVTREGGVKRREEEWQEGGILRVCFSAWAGSVWGVGMLGLEGFGVSMLSCIIHKCKAPSRRAGAALQLDR